MQILSYEYRAIEQTGWRFSKVEFKKVNLLVGDTGTGKTSLLNTIFNLGTYAVNKNSEITTGIWNIVLKQGDTTYRWHLKVVDEPVTGRVVAKEDIWTIDDTGVEKSLVERDSDRFTLEGREMPKLSRDQTSILLLQEEDSIKPLFMGFKLILRRHFSRDALEKAATYQPLPRDLLKRIGKEKDLGMILKHDLMLSARLFILKEYFPNLYKKIVQDYIEVFPFITATNVLNLDEIHKEVGAVGKVPVFCTEQKGVREWVELNELSSGMQKILLMLTDVYMLPGGSVYLVDEYENSLGISTIDFLPSILINEELDKQFIITSHHPYIINSIPIKNWYVFHRDGSNVTIKYGNELVERYGKSKQEAFTKLINDPFYKNGAE
jgi:hypothetical protein